MSLASSLGIVLALFMYSGSVFAAWTSTTANSQQPRVISGYTIQGIDGDVEKNVGIYLSQLTGEQPSRQLKRYATEQVLLSLRALGYYHADVDLYLEDNTQTPRVVAKIIPGKPVRINSISYSLIGAGEQDEQLTSVIEQLPLKQGDVLNHGNYEKAKSKLDSQLLEMGYFDSKWTASSLSVNRARYSADIVMQIETGQRYHFGPLNISTDTSASNYIHSLSHFKTGEPYSATKVSEFNLALTQTPYFSSVRVYADIAQRGNLEVPIRVEVLHKPTNSYEVGGGFSTDLGPKVRFKWSRPWLGTDGHYIESNFNISEPQQDISLSYTVPVDDPIDDIWRFSVGYKLEDNEDTEIYTKTLTGLLQRQWKIGDDWIRTVFLRRELEVFRIGEAEQKTKMLLPGVSFARQYSKGGTTPYWGKQWLISAEVGADSVASSTNIVRLQMQYAWLDTFFDKHMLFSKINLGAMYVDNINEVPVSLRFYAGGDQSVRGFKYESISPEVQGLKIGGKYLVAGTVEYNYQFATKWRSAFFVDAGTATNDFSEDLSVGVGVGIRYLTPVGPIRLDCAWAVSESDNPARLSITVGPEI
ncbi:autotransporter assembly complex protein TamA [Pseudoalteromonas pernae]|uniref:autotransporter assembly complex protein TamA n=1 Tax=Pseudoalteromonas pernae TaxID=3118054 RepID=UPI003242535B